MVHEVPMGMDVVNLEAAYQKAARHARACTKCSMPIVDEDGNPGYYSEACRTGQILLATEVPERKGKRLGDWRTLYRTVKARR